jgi:hypothetical protein
VSDIKGDGAGGVAINVVGRGGNREFGFYPSSPIWVGSPVTVSGATEAWVFTKQMEEEVYQQACEHFKLSVCRDGLIMLQVTGLEAEWPQVETPETLVRWWGRYIEFANCAHLLLDAAVMEKMNLSYGRFAEITRSDTLVVRHNGGSVTSTGYSGPGVSGRYLERYLSLHEGNDGIRLFHRQCLNLDVFPVLAQKLEAAMRDVATVRHLATIARGLSQYKVGNYQLSLVLAWFVVESILFAKWRRFLGEAQESFPSGEKRINRERMEALEGRDYPASVVANLLELEGEMSFDVFRSIDRVRRNRNKVVHQELGFECTAAQCKEALTLATDLVTEGAGFTCPLDLSYMVAG